MNRRTFLANAFSGLGRLAGGLGLVGGMAATGGMLPSMRARPRPSSTLSRFGIQLYTVRGPMGQDLEGVLLELGEMGYHEVEFAGYFGRPPSALRRILEEAGLDAPAAHVGFDTLDDGWDATLETARAVGHRWVVVPWIPEEARTGTESYRSVARRFNRAGEAAHRAGLRFAYHNHAFEFERTPEGDLPFDVLLAETDPAVVDFEMDVYWTVRGQADPLEYLRRFSGRFPLAHFKDMDEEGGMVDLGEGIIDFQRLLQEADPADFAHVFMEHDHPSDPMATARAGLEHLRALARPGLPLVP